MTSRAKVAVIGLFATAVAVIVAACASRAPASRPGGTAWGVGAFGSNGERIYFTATSDRGAAIAYTGGPASGMMMGGGRLACASCHGAGRRGGVHTMHMQTMNAPDIRWSVLAGEMEGEQGGESEAEGGHGEMEAGYDLETFGLAVVEGKHPDGTPLSASMPRWNINDEDLGDPAEFLKTLP